MDFSTVASSRYGMSTHERKPYPSDVSDDEWQLLLPYLLLMREDAPQRIYDLQEIFNAIRSVAKTGCQWRFLPNDFPSWTAVYQQDRRWMDAGVFAQITQDLRVLLRFFEGRNEQSSAVVFDGRTLQSSPESGARAGTDGAKKKKGSQIHIAVDTLGHLLGLKATAGNEQERSQVAALSEELQELTGGTVEVAVDQGYTGEETA